MIVLSLASLLRQKTKEQIYTFGLGIANGVGLPVSSWQAGDPTRSMFLIESEILGEMEGVAVGFIGSGFLDEAVGDWRRFTAKQGFNVDVPEATFATTDVVLTNPSSQVYTDIQPGDITFKSTISGKTFHNINSGVPTPGVLGAKVGLVNGTLTITVEADEPGSDSSAGAGEIDQIVSGLGGTVTCTNPQAAIGVDEQDWAVTKQQCLDKLGSLSPNGDAYAFVARTPLLAGTSAVTRVRVYGSSETGDVVMYLAGPSGGLSETDRALVEKGILKYATGLCITPTVLSATDIVIAVTYELWIYKSVNKTAAEVQAAVLRSLGTLVATRDIGGDIIPPATTGELSLSGIASAITAPFGGKAFRVAVTTPAGDTALTNGQVPTLGAVDGTINIVKDP